MKNFLFWVFFGLPALLLLASAIPEMASIFIGILILLGLKWMGVGDFISEYLDDEKRKR